MKITKDIIFPPEETSSLLSEILKKYEIYETDNELTKKINAGKINATCTVISVLNKMATSKITIDEAIEKLKNDLMLSHETAQQLANELKDRVVPLGKERSIFQKENNKEIEKAEVRKEPLPQKEKIANPYREPLE